MALAFHLGRRVPDWDFGLKVIGKKEQFRARNNLVTYAVSFLKNDNDVLWMLDDDMIVMPDTFERLVKVLDEKPDAGLVGGLYWQRGGTYRPVIQKLVKVNDTYGTEWYLPHEITGEVMRVGIQGGGCMMFPIRALKTLIPPVFWVDGIVGTDIWVASRLNQAGWKIYCDTGIELGHLDEARDVPSRVRFRPPVGLFKRDDESVYAITVPLFRCATETKYVGNPSLETQY